MTIDHASIAQEVEDRFGDFFREKINPTAMHRDQTYTTFDTETLREMGRLGLIGFTADKSIGGGGRTWEEWGHALEEIGYLADDSGLPMLLSYRETANNLLHHSGLQGRPHLIERYAKPAVRGEAFIGWLYTEEKDAFNFETTAVKQGDRYILNGHKTASTGGLSCTSWIVYAATENGSDTQPKVRFNRKLSEFDTFKAGIGRMQMAMERARSTAYRMFEGVEAGRETKSYLHDPLVSIGKYISTEAALEVADIAQRLSGGHGYFEPYGIDRYLRDFYGLVPIIGGQTAIEAEIGGRVIWQRERRLKAQQK